jgi:hypothetical protein
MDAPDQLGPPDAKECNDDHFGHKDRWPCDERPFGPIAYFANCDDAANPRDA